MCLRDELIQKTTKKEKEGGQRRFKRTHGAIKFRKIQTGLEGTGQGGGVFGVMSLVTTGRIGLMMCDLI